MTPTHSLSCASNYPIPRACNCWLAVVVCPHCGVERWAGDGPCSSCGKRMRLLTEDNSGGAGDTQAHQPVHTEACTPWTA